MLDTPDSGRPKRHTALIANDLSRLNVDIAAVSEVLFQEQGSLQEHDAVHTLYWSGNSVVESHISGIGFMIRDSIASKLENLPSGYSDRIISASPTE